jgi:hypothetical protein
MVIYADEERGWVSASPDGAELSDKRSHKPSAEEGGL